MANNPFVNKVVFGSATLVDLTGTTATADKILAGYGAFGADGAWMDGTATGGGGAGVVYQDEDGYIVIDDAEPYSRTISITENGTYNVAGYGTADVSVSGGTTALQTIAKTYTPTESQQTETITPGTGYDGIGEVDVTVSAIPSNYVGSGVTQRSSSDLTASGATVTAPAGYYASAATKTISSGSATTPATTVTANPSISVSSGGLITATASTTKSVTPTVSAGYVSNGTAGTITVSGSNTSQLTTQAAQTIHPSTTDQSINSGRYLTGTQTIKAVTTTNLSASYILSGVTIKVGDSTDDDCVASVTGNVTFSTIYTGSTNPSSGTGVNGDVYIKTS